MTYYLKRGSTYNVNAQADLDVHDTLPAGTYTVQFDMQRDIFYLETVDNFEIKGKVYGDTLITAERIMHTFRDRSASTGVLLTGEKGSGKTLLSKMLSIKARALGIPTIIINMPWHGEPFNVFMQMIDQPAVVIFDEFEKVYDSEKQEKMLTLLDGVYPSKKLFVLTCNDKWRMNNHMNNRPGRLFYRLEYTGLDSDFIAEYCEDNLKNKDHIQSVCRIALAFDQFNFDMLQAMVEEMNRYGETPQEVMKVINARPEMSDPASYTTNLIVGGKTIDTKDLHSELWRGNPLVSPVGVAYDVENGEDYENAVFSPTDLKHVDSSTGAFRFVNNKGDQLSLVRVKEAKYYDYNAF